MMLRKRLSQILIILLLFGQFSTVLVLGETIGDLGIQTEVSDTAAVVAETSEVTTEPSAEPSAEPSTEPSTEPTEETTESDVEVLSTLGVEPAVVPSSDGSLVVDVNDIDLTDPDVSNKYFVVKYEDGTVEIRTVPNPDSVGLRSISSESVEIEGQMALYEEKSNVEIVEPLIIRKAYGSEAHYVPNDPYYVSDSLWGIEYINADDLYGWDYTQALSTVVIAVIDTGMDMDHPDLAASLASVDRGDGVMVNGYDAVSTDYNPEDGHGHGTHCAGTAAGIVNNGIGVAGVAGGAKILPIKVLSDSGTGTSVDVAEGIEWAVDHGADVISMSLGSSSPSQVELDAVNYAYANGVVVIAATGNDSNNWDSGPADIQLQYFDPGDPVEYNPVGYPAAYDHVIGVGSVGVHGGQVILSDFSNSGTAVDVVAPGEGVLSTYKNAQYATMSGTSMATPHVSGLAALVLAENPTYTPAQVEAAIEGAAQMVTSGTDSTYGGNANYYGVGIVDAYGAINTTLLNNLELSVGSITFSPGTASYSITLDYDTTSIGIRPTARSVNQTLTVDGSSYTGTGYASVSLDVGSNSIPIVVTAADGVTTGTYTLNVTRSVADASLSALTISQGTLTPAFSGATTSYTATVASAVSSMNLSASSVDSHSVLTVDGAAYTAGATKTVALAFGTHDITVVSNAHGTAKTYTITVTRPYYTDKTLHSLSLSTGTLSPAFSAGTTSYTASVGAGVTGLNITATADAYAEIRINTGVCTSGVPFPVTLPAGSNVFSIEVTAHNGDQQTYTLTVNRNDFTNAKLSMVKVSNVNIAGFDDDTLTYTYDCDSAVASPPAVSATKAVTEATVVIDQATNFTTDNVATLVVTAVDGTTQKTYTVEFNRFTVMDNGSSTVSLGIADPAAVVLLEIPETVASPQITVTTANNGTTITSTLPEITAERTEDGDAVARMEIAGGTVVSALSGSAWNGTIALPTIKETPSVSPSSSTVNTVIELGYPGTTLTFSKAVRILIPGMAGKSVGYVSGGVFHAITNTLGSDTQAAGDDLNAGSDGKITVGSDLVVWTKHFTEFVAYTPVQAASTSTGGGGGGGGGASGAEVIVKVNAESSMNAGTLTVTFGPNSYYSEFQASMNPVGYSYSPFKVNQRLVDKVYIVNKNMDGALEKPMALSFAVNLKTTKLTNERLALYYLDAKTNTWLELPGVAVDLVKGTVTGSSKLFTEYAVLAVPLAEAVPVVVPTVPVISNPSFSDLSNHWAAEKVAALVAKKAIAGYPDGSFRPDAPITRAEFIAVLVKAQGMKGYQDMSFPDLEGHWAKEVIRIGYASGAVSGYGDGMFRPDDPITREQMAVMVDRTLRYASELAPLTVTDQDEISSWALGPIRRILSFKVMNGYPDNTFRPGALATRAEAVAVILKTIGN